MDLTDIKHLFEYTQWANQLAILSAEKLPDQDLRREVGISHKSIYGTLLHMAGAEWIWLERWHGRSPARDEAWSQWTPEACGDLSVLKDRWSDIVSKRLNYISELDDSSLSHQLPFKLLNGDQGSMRLADQLLHVVNHATLHRGQVVGMIRQLGVEPPNTDLLFYIRQKA